MPHRAWARRDLTDIAARQSGPRAFGMAGVTHDDVDLCMIYDSFTITVLADAREPRLLRQAARAAPSCRAAGIGLGGALPVNTDGGGLSSNHPGMRGIFLVIEAVQQLRGECGARQVADCAVALVPRHRRHARPAPQRRDADLGR